MKASKKRLPLDLSRWIGRAVEDGLSTEEALAELRRRPYPWLPEGVEVDASDAVPEPGPGSGAGPVRKAG